jgi:hypothetical protein
MRIFSLNSPPWRERNRYETQGQANASSNANQAHPAEAGPGPVGTCIFYSFSIELSRGFAILLPMKRNSIEDRPASGAPLNPVEAEVIHLFVQLSRALGQPKP